MRFSKLFLFATASLGVFLGILFALWMARVWEIAPAESREKQVRAFVPTHRVAPAPIAPASLRWVSAAANAPWQARDSGEVFLFDEKMWMIGGLNGNANVVEHGVVDYAAAPHFNDIWSTQDGVRWTRAASSSAWAPRRSMSVVFFKDKLWMFGGWSPVTGYTNDIWTSDDAVHWERIVENADWPAREGQLAEVFQNKIWLIGGVNYDERKTKNDVWYSENGLDWTQAEHIPWQPRWDHATAVFDGTLFLAGGMDLEGRLFSDVWTSEDGLHWTLRADQTAWGARQGHALIPYQETLWLIGRLSSAETGGANDVWFSRDGVVWEKTKGDPQWTGREDFFSAVFNDRVWVFGGMDTNWQWRNDVWASEFSTTAEWTAQDSNL